MNREPKQTDGGENVDLSGSGSRCHALKTRLISAWGAWILYMKHPIRDAGLGLALLFMTVLAFDNYSRGKWFID